VAGSALGGALLAFLVSWAVIGHDGSSDRLPTSSDGRVAQGQAPASGSASGSTGRPQGQSQSSSGSAGSSTGQSQRQSQRGAMPSARSGAS
jgi:hypothetical protein